MEEFQKAKDLIKRAERIFIFLPEGYSKPSLKSIKAGDIFCSGAALFNLFKKLGKECYFQPDGIPQRFEKLGCPAPDCKEIVISINASGKSLSEMRYEKDGDKLKILISANQGSFSKDDVEVSSRSLTNLPDGPDLIVTVGAQKLRDLGESLKIKSDFQIPLINIDNDPLNENFGQINLLENDALSISEIVTKLIGEIDESLFDRKIANYLLAGLLSSSFNFHHPKTNSQVFDISSYLIERGAEYNYVLETLSQGKTITQNRLLGQAFKKLGFNEEKNVYISTLSENDLKETGAQPKDLAQVIEGLRANLGINASLLLLWESHASPPAIKGVFYSLNSSSTEKIAERFGGQIKGDGVLFLVMEKDIEIATRKILDIL